MVHVVDAQQPREKTFTKDELHKDFQIFRGSLEDFHPGLYAFRSPTEMQLIFREALDQIDEPLTEREYLRELSKVAAQIGCGHTDVVLSDASYALTNRFFPLKLHFSGDQAFFIKDYRGESSLPIRVGDEVVSINGVQMDSLIAECMEMMTGDGFITTGKYHSLNNYFWYIHTYYFGAVTSYKIKYRDSNQELRETSFGTIDRKTVFDRYRREQAAKNQANLTLRYSEQELVAIMTIKSFFDWEEGDQRINFNNRLQEIFQELDRKQINRLVLDLRDNGGGKEPWRLFAYLHDQPIAFASQAKYKYSRKSEYASYQQLDPSMRWIKRTTLNQILPGSNKTKKLNDSTYLLTELYLTKPFKPLFPQYQGKVVILTNGGTFSAAALFASVMRSYDKAVFVGEETGGAYHGNNSMNPTYVTLPNSGIKVHIPLVRFSLDVEEKVELGRGIVPDHAIVPSTTDLINDVDVQLIYALNLLR